MLNPTTKSIKTRVMDFVSANGNSARFVDIQKFIIEEIYGWIYVSAKHRGQHTSSFRDAKNRVGYFLRPGKEKRYLVKCPNGRYSVVQ